MDGSAGRPQGQMNVLGSPLASCSHDPVTGFFRDGCCNTSPSDRGLHTVCAIMTDAFLEYSKAAGNDLSTPHPEFGFPGLKAGDQWCLMQYLLKAWPTIIELASVYKRLREFEYKLKFVDDKEHAID